MRNKKGDIPITLLVIGVFAICSLALLTFFIYDFRMSNSFVGIKVMEKMDAAIEEYYFYLNQGISKDVAQDYFSVKEENGARYFYYDKTYYKTSFLNFNREKVLLFSVQYQVP